MSHRPFHPRASKSSLSSRPGLREVATTAFVVTGLAVSISGLALSIGSNVVLPPPANPPSPPSGPPAAAQHGHGKDIKYEDARKSNLRGRIDQAAERGRKPTGAIVDRAFDLMDYLVKRRGWTPAAAAIAAGNAEQESSIYWAGAAGDNGISHGTFQWNRERFAALQAFAASKGKPWTDKMAQYEFFANEAERMLPNWKRQMSLDSAGAISHSYEGYSDASTETRVNNARKWLGAYRERPEQVATSALAPPSGATLRALNPVRDLLMLLGSKLNRFRVLAKEAYP